MDQQVGAVTGTTEATGVTGAEIEVITMAAGVVEVEAAVSHMPKSTDHQETLTTELLLKT